MDREESNGDARIMPNPGSDEPLTKVTLNLYEEDVKTLKARYGFGWTEYVRTLVRSNLRQRKTVEQMLKGKSDD